MKAKDYFEEKKSNMRELWNLSDTQKEVMYSLMEQYVALHIADVSGSLPDIYSGELNIERIKQYKHLAEGYNVSESTVRDIFCRGAEWYKHILSNDR